MLKTKGQEYMCLSLLGGQELNPTVGNYQTRASLNEHIVENG